MKIIWSFIGFWGSGYVENIIKKNKDILTKTRPRNLFIRELSDIDFIFYLKRHLNDNLLHITDVYQAYLLNFIKSQKSVVTCYDIIPAVIPEDYGLRTKIQFKFNLSGLKKARRIIVPSISTLNDLVRCVGISREKIKMIPFGVDHKLFKPSKDKQKIKEQIKRKYAIPEKNRIILYVGGDYPRKNVPTLLRAFSLLKNEATLIKIGGDLYPAGGKKSSKLINELGIKQKVIDIPRKTMKNLPMFYNVADIFVFPSYYEGFGLPLLEAMACGCPVITTDRSSMPEVVGDAAIKLNDPFDYKLLAKKIDEVLNNDRLRQKMIKDGLIRSNKFSWEKHAEEVYKIYKEIWNEK